MDGAAIATIAVTVLLALTGYLATYWNNLRVAQRKARLERINRQLSEFYGPLFSLVHISSALYGKFAVKHTDKYGPWGPSGFSTEEAQQDFELWMREVFMPLNERMVEVILTKAELIEGPAIPKVLQDLSANGWGWKPILKRWEAGDYAHQWSLIRFPTAEILQYTEDGLRRVKEEQRKLLGQLHQT